MLTQEIPEECSHGRAASSDPLHENVQLVRRISQLRGAVEAASRDNAGLRWKLAHAVRENEELRNQATAQTRHAHKRRTQWRDALSDTWSRNP